MLTSESASGSDIIRGNNIIRVGEEINTFHLPMWAGINPANGEPLFYNSDGDITNVYDSDARCYKFNGIRFLFFNSW